MAGAMGNCYDRLVLGHVRDFVHFHVDAINFDCAIFNFADNMLVDRRAHAGALRPSAREKPPSEPSRRRRVDPTRRDASTAAHERPPRRRSPSTSSGRSDARRRRCTRCDWLAPARALHVVVERELVRMRADADRLDFVGLLVPDPGVDDVGREDVAAEQEFVVGLQGFERGFERPRGGRDVVELFGLKVVDVLIERVAGPQLVLDAVEDRP